MNTKITDFPAREASTIGTLHLTRESAFLLKDLLNKAAMPLSAAKHLLPLSEQLDKVVATLSADKPDGP